MMLSLSLYTHRTKPLCSMLLCCCVLSGCLLYSATVASASKDYGFSSSFGSFTAASGVAVDDSSGAQSGDVYVVDQGTGSVERFTAAQAAADETGTPLSGAVLSDPYGVAVDDSAGPLQGDVYVTDPAAGTIDRFNGTSGKFEMSFGGSETPHTRSFEPQGVAVGPVNGDVFVTDAHNGAVDIFSSAGVYIPGSQFGIGVLSAPNGIAIDAGEDAYVTNAGGPSYEFASAGGYTSVFPLTGASTAVGVEQASGDVYIDTGSTIEELNQNNELLGAFGAGDIGGSLGIGVSNSGSVYASSPSSVSIFDLGETPGTPTTGLATAVTGTTATLNGTLSNGGGENTTYHFAYKSTAPCTGGGETPTETAAKGVSPTEIGGLSPNSPYTFCLVATNSYGSSVGGEVSFTTKTVKPVVGSVAISHLGFTSAVVSGRIDMENSSGDYYYEYGTPEQFAGKIQQRTTEVSLAASEATALASAELTGLQPLTEYEVRLVAVNAGQEITESETLAFTSPSTKGATLPDNRVYEMVTPVENDDAEVYVPLAVKGFEINEGIYTDRPFQVSTDGESVVYVATPIHGGLASGLGGGNNYMATRSATGGWTQTDLQPSGFEGAEYQAFSSDLAVGVLSSGYRELAELPGLPGTEAPGDGYSVLYTRSASDGRYHAFFSKPPLNRSTGGNGEYVLRPWDSFGSALAFVGASADFHDLFFEANEAMPGTGAVDGGSEENNLYESVDGQLYLVNILPDGSTEANATFGAQEAKSEKERQTDFSNVISSDGSRAFWTDLNTNDLYVSENVGTSSEKTVQVDASQVGGVGGGGKFWTASSDGSKVFFTDSATAGLTDDTQSGSGENLYEYEVESGGLKDLTSDAEAGVLGVIGASENGEYVYFVATGVLSGSENAEHQQAISGGDNLYLSRNGDEPVFISTLSSLDEGRVRPIEFAGGFGDWEQDLAHRTAQVTANGDALVFMSRVQLTSYPNMGYEEVYVYDATDNKLSCASCNPSGQEPEFSEEPEFVGGLVPVSWSNTSMIRWMSENGGRVFFDSEQSLVPEDTNGKQDVYEWERQGEGSCTQARGCIYLLSGGTSESASWLIGASADGGSVFIATRAQLAPEDQNENFDLYDVRVDGVEPTPPPQCTGTGCQGLPSPPPTFATPPSVTFAGVGNFPSPPLATKTTPKPLTRGQKLAKALAACHAKHNKRKRTACEAQARKRYGAPAKPKKEVHRN